MSARQPLIVLIFFFTLGGLSIYGIRKLEITSDPIELWVKPESELN